MRERQQRADLAVEVVEQLVALLLDRRRAPAVFAAGGRTASCARMSLEVAERLLVAQDVHVAAAWRSRPARCRSSGSSEPSFGPISRVLLEGVLVLHVVGEQVHLQRRAQGDLALRAWPAWNSARGSCRPESTASGATASRRSPGTARPSRRGWRGSVGRASGRRRTARLAGASQTTASAPIASDSPRRCVPRGTGTPGPLPPVWVQAGRPAPRRRRLAPSRPASPRGPTRH